tara:strand:+ start:8941 stop:10482 length:1542 start_codon:yes stop_codon:yes gene_type:complete
MAIKRYKADADTTIVNAFQPNLETRGTGANAGLADVMEVFSIYGRETTSSQELSRILVKFPIASISADRTNGTLPASGNVSFYLRLFDAESSKTIPTNYTLMVYPVSRSWEEGIGLDLEGYKDQVDQNTGANWISCSKGIPWDLVGGDYLTSSGVPSYSQTFTTGIEDMKIDISDLVEKWIAGTYDNNGVGIQLTASQEAYFSASTAANDYPGASGSVLWRLDGSTESYYTKRFFARGSQYFFKRPVLEARWDDRVTDDRGDFYYSSSLAPAADNLNTIYLYNYVRGRLTDIPGLTDGLLKVNLYSGSATPTGSKLVLYDGTTALTGGHVSTGIYSCSIGITASSTPLQTLFDVWHTSSGGTRTEFFTGSITPVEMRASEVVTEPTYYMNITNLKDKYRNNETARFNLYVRKKNWSPTIYTIANANPENLTVHSASYRVYRLLDGYEAVAYGTGSELSTLLSHDISGNYFDFDMNLLEPGYAYGFKFAFYDYGVSSWVEQPYVFKFRVAEYEY